MASTPSSSGQAPVVIVGAGQAGAEAAMALRRDGHAGPVLLLGREGHPPYERPPLSKKFLLGDVPCDRLPFRDAPAYAAQGVELMLDTPVESIDADAATVTLGDGRVLAYGHCILATGASPRRLPVPGGDLPGSHVLRTLDEAAALRSVLGPGRRLVVAGGGYLGLEAAASAAKLGARVSVVEACPALLQRSASAITAQALAARHRAAGVTLILDRRIDRVEGNGRVERVVLSDGSALDADLLLVAIGAAPETALAEQAGIACRNGILVDAHCRTSAKAVYAIGDCANHLNPRFGRHLRLEAVQSATYQARCASAAIMGKPPPPARLPYFWSEQFDAKLQIAGCVETDRPLEDVLVGDVASAFAVYRIQEGELRAVEAVNRPQDFVRAQTMIGRRDFTLPDA